MSAGDDILLIVVFYFPPFSSQLVEPHLLPSLSQVESLPAPPLPTPLRCLLIVWAWRRIISPVSILMLLEVNPPHPEMIHLTGWRPEPFPEIAGACHQLWTSTNAASVWKTSVLAPWRYGGMWDVSVWVRVELSFVALTKYHFIWSLNELLCSRHEHWVEKKNP